MLRSDCRQVARHLAFALAFSAAACSDPMGIGGSPSSFRADVTGDFTRSISGTAEWSHESVQQVTPPGGGPITAIRLASEGGQETITISRAGTSLEVGTFAFWRPRSGSPPVRSPFTAAYVRWQTDAFQVFLADSGSLTITSVGNHVRGEFVLYADQFDLLPRPKPGERTSGIITPIGSGRASVQISGSFDAPVAPVRRRW